jgi:hypothetical protein
VHANKISKNGCQLFFCCNLGNFQGLFPISAPALSSVPTHTIARSSLPKNRYSRVVGGWFGGTGHGERLPWPQRITSMNGQGMVWMGGSESV